MKHDLGEKMRLIYGNLQSSVMRLLGEQKKSLTEYRMMNFCIKKEVNGRNLIYNNFTKLLAELSEEEYSALKSGEIKYSSLLDELISKWFLVPISNDDVQLCEQIFNLISLSSKKVGINNFVIFTTSDCNARCFYCFENGVQRENMSEQTALDVCEYIKKVSNGEKVSLKWFGGEPLYNAKVIDIISNYLKSNEIEFSSKMTSNGFLFDDSTILRAKESWNLKRVQITLDGTEKVYNKIKNYIYTDCPNPFKRVIGNISKLIENQICVTIRLNVSDANRSDIYSLIDYLSKIFNPSDYLKIYVSNLYDLEHILDDYERVRLLDEIFKIDSYLVDIGFTRYGLEKWNHYGRSCMAHNDNSIVITPTGLLGKCEHFSEGDKLFGSIYGSKKEQKVIDFWNKCSRIDECSKCVLYPNCIGITNCPCSYGKCDSADRMVRIYDLEKSILTEAFKHDKV